MLRYFLVLFSLICVQLHAHVLTEDVATVRPAIKALKSDFADDSALKAAEMCFRKIKETDLKDAHIVWRFLGALMMTGHEVLQGLHDSIVRSGYDANNDWLKLIGYSWAADKKMNAADARILQSRFYMELAKEKDKGTAAFTTQDVWAVWQSAEQLPARVLFSADNINAVYWSALLQADTFTDVWISIFGEVKVVAEVSAVSPRKVHDTGSSVDVQNAIKRAATVAAVSAHVSDVVKSVQNLDGKPARVRWFAFDDVLKKLSAIPEVDKSALNPQHQKGLDREIKKIGEQKDAAAKEVADYVEEEKKKAGNLVNTLKGMNLHGQTQGLSDAIAILKKARDTAAGILDKAYLDDLDKRMEDMADQKDKINREQTGTSSTQGGGKPQSGAVRLGENKRKEKKEDGCAC